MLIKKLVVFLVLMAGCAIAQSDPQPQSQPAGHGGWTLERATKDSQGCIFVNDAGDMYDTWWGNSCPQPMQFTIQWSGHHAPQNTTYRTNGRPFIRHVTRADEKGVLISEAPIEAGLGRKVEDVTIEKNDLSLGQTQIFLRNPEETPVFVTGYISIEKNGKEVRRCELNMDIANSERMPACVYFSGESFTPKFTAEKDPL